MKGVWKAIIYLMLNIAVCSFANPAKRNKELEARRDKRLAAEKAAAAATGKAFNPAAQATTSSNVIKISLSERYRTVSTPKQTVDKSTTLSLPKSRFNPDFASSLATQGKRYFEKVWREDNLGVHMSAQALADSVKMMSAAGLDSQTAKMLVREKLRNSPSKEYCDAFVHRSRQWGVAVANAKRLISLQDPALNQLDEMERRKRVYLRASQTITHNKLDASRAKIAMGLVKERKYYGRKKAIIDQRQALVEHVGEAFRKHLLRKEMDFDRMTPEQLESESRGLTYPGVRPLTYPKLLVEYVGSQRPSDEVKRFRAKRVKFNTMSQRQRLKNDST